MINSSPSYSCAVCNFDLWIPIYDLQVSTLGLYNDQRFPGRCILAINEHYDDFASIPKVMAAQYTEDTQLSGRAIQAAVGADRINYAVLGNTLSHVHYHLIPRKHLGDPQAHRPPWESTLEKGSMSDEDLNSTKKAIAAALADLQRDEKAQI